MEMKINFNQLFGTSN